MGFRELTFAPESVFLVTGGAGFIGSNLCEAILACNRETGERAKLRKEVCDAVRNWKAQAEQIAALERLGFTVIKGKKHYKLRWRDSGYFKALSASPSDMRTGANSVADAVSLFF